MKLRISLIKRLGFLGPALLAAVAGFAAGCAVVPDRAAPPNVLVLVIDALRGDRLGANGYDKPTTPVLDQMASEGLNFTRAYAHSTWTKSSIASLFTSLYPSQHGIRLVGVETPDGTIYTDVLEDRFTTMAELFQAGGYVTGAVINQIHLMERFGFRQGFEHFVTLRGRTAFQLNRNLGKWLEELDGDRPFFAYLHYLDPHWPYTRSLADGPPLGPTAMTSKPPNRGVDAIVWAQEDLSPADRGALQARYDREVAYADQAVGEMLDILQLQGRLDDTVIVVTSDHGEAFFEHGRILHGEEPFQEQIHVPLLLRPAAASGITGSTPAVIEEPVGLVDVLPTLLELVGLPPAPEARGIDLLTLAGTESPDGRVVFSEVRDTYAAQSRSHKLMLVQGAEPECFDLALDPGEEQPMAVKGRPPCRRLMQQLRPFVRLMRRSAAARTGQKTPLSEDEIKQLKSLGYL